MKSIKKKSVVWGAATSLIFTAALSAATSTRVLAIERSSRLWRENRYKTSIEVSKNGWVTSDYAIIVRGDEFADALCAAPLAQKYNAPILLNDSNVLQEEVRDEIQRLKVKNIIIIGGSGVISSNVEEQLKNIATVERIGGQDRYETSVKVAKKVGISSKIVIACGENFPDALSIASIAAEKQMPILLTPKADLPSIVKEYINMNNIEQTYIIGGEGAVSLKIENEVPKPKRLSGKDRYETNTAILNEFKNELNFDNIYVAAGDGTTSSSGKKEGFADALSGAPLAAKNSAPIILTYNNISDPVKVFMDSSKMVLTPKTKVTAIGGEAVVPQSIIETLKEATTLTFVDRNEKGKTYDAVMKESENNVKISADDVVLKNEKIKGNVYVYGNNAKLQDLTIDGTVFVDPGDNGTAYLDNVKANSIKVRSGAESSIHFNGVTADYLQVESSDINKSVRIEASGSMNIKNTVILSNVSIDGGQDSFGNILISNAGLTKKTIELKGNFTKPVTVSGSANINAIEGANVAKLQLQPDNEDSLVTLKGKFTDVDVKTPLALEIKENSNITGTLTAGASTALNISASSFVSNLQVPEGALAVKVDLNGSGEIQNIQVKNKDAVVSIPTETKVTGKIETVNKDSISAQDPKVAGSVEVKTVDQMGGGIAFSGGGGGGSIAQDTTAPTIQSMTLSGSTKNVSAVISDSEIIFNIPDAVGASDKFNDGNITVSENLKKVSLNFSPTTSVSFDNDGKEITSTNLATFIRTTLNGKDLTGDGISKSTFKNYFDGTVIKITDISGNVKEYTLRIFTSSVESLNNGQQVSENIKLDEALTYGSVSKRATVTGDVTITGDGASLNNVDINGILTINPGDNGTVYLNSVHATTINVISGAWNSVHLDGVSASSMTVSNDNTVRIVASGGTNIDKTKVESGGKLELAGEGSSMGDVEVASNNESSLELKGNFTNVNVTGSGQLNLSENSSAVTINVSGMGAEVNVGENGSVGSVSLGSAATGSILNVGDGANAGNVSVNAQGSTVNVSGTNSQVGTLDVSGSEAQVNVSGTNSQVGTLDVSGSGAQVNGNGTIQALTVSTEAAKTIILDGCTLTDKKAEVTNSTGLLYALNKSDIEEITIKSGDYSIKENEIKRNLTIIGKSSEAVTLKTNSGAFFSVGDVFTLTLSNIAFTGDNLICVAYTGESGVVVGEYAVLSYKDISNAIDALNVDNATIQNAEPVKKMLTAVLDTDTNKPALLKNFNSAVITIYVGEANKALAELPEVSSVNTTINYANINESIALVNDADSKYKAAVEMGGTSFTGADKLLPAKNRIAAINIAAKAISLVPKASNINLSNLADAKAKVDNAKALVAKAAGAFKDADLTILNAADDKITSIINANNALKAVPTGDSISSSNLLDVKTKISSAETAVSTARSEGAVDTDFLGLDRLDSAKMKVIQLEKAQAEKAAAVKKANDLIELVPLPERITISNLADTNTKIAAAQEAVEDARNKGAMDSDFVNLRRINDAVNKVETLVTGKDGAISLAKDLLKAIPSPEKIKTAIEIADAKSKIKAAQNAVNAAKKLYNAEDSDFKEGSTNLLDRITAANNKIANLESAQKAKEDSIKAANIALSSIPLAQSITRGMIIDKTKYDSLMEKVNDADAKVSDAYSKGAAESDFIGLDRLSNIKDRISQLKNAEADRLVALKTANEALSKVPATDSITMDNLMTSDALVQSAVNAVNVARAKGTSDIEFIGLDKLKPAQDKVKELKLQIADKKSAIALAIVALNNLPEATSINEATLADAKAKVQAAENAIELAMAKGANKDSDFSAGSLSKLESVKTAINTVETTLQQRKDAINTANNALKEIPSPEYITETNVKTVEAKIKAAEDAISVAVTEGAANSDFIGLDKLQSAKDRVSAIDAVITERNAAIVAANTALKAIPNVESITDLATANAAKAKISEAESKVQTARDMGAKDSDFTENGTNLLQIITDVKTKIAEVEAGATADEIKSAAIEAAIAAVDSIPEEIIETNLEDAKAKVQAAIDAVNSAKSKGATEKELENCITKISSVQSKIADIENRITLRKDAIDAANIALKAIVSAGSINDSNYLEVESRVTVAELAVTTAKESGAKECDFVGINKMEEAKTKIAEIRAKKEAIKFANIAIANIPNAEDIKTYEDGEKAKILIGDAETKINDAKSKGAQDSDFVGLERINAAKQKLEFLRMTKEEAIKIATDAANSIPKEIIENNLEDVKAKVQTAEVAVSSAEDKGATEEELKDCKAKISVAKSQISIIENTIALRKEAIKSANVAIADIPNAEDIKTYEDGEKTKILISDAETKISDAKSKGAQDSDFVGLERINAAKQKLEFLRMTKEEAIKTAINAANNIPETITEDILDDGKAKVQTAEVAVSSAEDKGATEEELKDCKVKISVAKSQISIIENTIALRKEAVVSANLAIQSIDSADLINDSNYIEVESKVTAAEQAVTKALDLGAKDTDFVGFNKIEEAKGKIAEIKAKKEAIKFANEAIANIPNSEDINTYEAAETVKLLVETAQSKISDAKSKGAQDSDFIGLNKIEEAKTKIEKLEAIKYANDSIANIPKSEDIITYEDAEAAKLLVETAQTKISDAKSKGAQDSEFVGINKIEEAKTKITMLEARHNAILEANSLITLLPDSKAVNLENAEDVKTKLKEVEDAIKSAIEKGAENNDFIGTEKIDSIKAKLAVIDKLADDKEQLTISYNGTSLTINLLAKAPNGSDITWSCASTAIDVSTGIVTRSFDGDENIILTAKLTQNILDKDEKIIDSVSTEKQIPIVVKKIGMTLSVKTIGKKVSIAVTNSEEQSNDVTIVLNDNKGNKEYIDQGKFVDGKITFNTVLDDGTYTGRIQTELFTMNIKEFTVNKNSAGVTTAEDFNTAMMDEEITDIGLQSQIELTQSYNRENLVKIKSNIDMKTMFNIVSGNITLSNIEIDTQDKNVSDAVIAVTGDSNVNLNNITIDNSNNSVAVILYGNAMLNVNKSVFKGASGIKITMNGNANIENSTFTGTSKLGCAISQIQSGDNETPLSVIKNNTITNFATTDATNSSAGIYIGVGSSEISGNTINGCYDGISVKDGAIVNGIKGGINIGLKLKELNPQTINNKRANVIVFNDSSIIYKDIVSASAVVVVDGDKVTIHVKSDSTIHGDATLRILDSKGNTAGTAQAEMVNGECTFVETLVNGEYTAFVKVPDLETPISVGSFTVNKQATVTTNVKVEGNDVTISIKCNTDIEGDVTYTISDSENGNVKFINQGTMIKGEFTIKARLDNGNYTAQVRIPGQDDVILIDIKVGN